MNGVNLDVSDKEKDVCIMIQEDLKPSKQCATAAAKGKSILGQMPDLSPIEIKLYGFYHIKA